MAQHMRYCRNYSRAADQWVSQSRRLLSPVSAMTSRSRCLEVRPASSSNKPSNSTQEMFSVRKAQRGNETKPNTLVVLFGFFRASEVAISKYCDMYHAYGFDVLYVKSVLKHFSWPRNSVLLSDSLLNHLEQHCASYDKYLVHAFSMGAYNFTVCMGTMYDKPELYSTTQSKICGIVYDSLTIGSLENMSVGVATAVAKNVLVRKMLIGLTNIYFSTTYKNTVMFYDRYISLFKEKPLQVATLCFYCRNDTMSDAKVIESIVEDWETKFSFPIVGKGWDKSKHAAHLLAHKEEYLGTLDSFLRNIPALAKEMKPVPPSKL